MIASYLVSLYYVAYWSALNFYGFTEQTPLTVFVATTKRAKNREVLNTKYNFITLNKRKFFGFQPVQIGTNRINISDREKTLVDALDHSEYCGGILETAKSLWNARDNVSMEKIIKYAGTMGNTAIIKRLCYLMEILKLTASSQILSEMKEMISLGMSALDPTSPKKGIYNTKWSLLLNVSKETLEELRRSL